MRLSFRWAGAVAEQWAAQRSMGFTSGWTERLLHSAAQPADSSYVGDVATLFNTIFYKC